MIEVLKFSSFRRLISGRILTNTGDSIYYITTMWLVYDLTNSSTITGFLSTLLLLPQCFQMFYGPIIDTYNIKKLLLISQFTQAILIGIVSSILILGVNNIYLIITLIVLSAFLGEVSYPISEKLVPILLPKNQLVNGNALMAFSNQTMDLVLNTLITFLISIFTVYFLYIANTLVFIFAGLFYLSIIGMNKKTENTSLNLISYTTSLKEGIHIVTHSLLWVFQIGAFMINLGIGLIYICLPVLANNIGHPIYYGLFISMISIGMVLSTFVVSYVKHLPLGSIIICTFFLSGIFLLVGLFLPINLYLICFGLSWMSVGLTNILIASTNQTIIPEEILGRVSSITSSIGILGMPLGSLIGGLLLNLINPITLVSLTGTCFLFLALLWFIHPDLRKLNQIECITIEDFHINLKLNNE